MQQSFDVWFATSNENKFAEAKEILQDFDVRLGLFKTSMCEIQSNSIQEIAMQKVTDAFTQCKKPVIIEDDGLFVDALGGFPGPYSSYVYDTIGNDGILRLLGSSNRSASFHSVIAYCDGTHNVAFEGKICGMIAKKASIRGWGYDPIFIPAGKSETFGEIDNKNTLSHRHASLAKFASWFARMQQAEG